MSGKGSSSKTVYRYVAQELSRWSSDLSFQSQSILKLDEHVLATKARHYARSLELPICELNLLQDTLTWAGKDQIILQKTKPNLDTWFDQAWHYLLPLLNHKVMKLRVDYNGFEFKRPLVDADALQLVFKNLGLAVIKRSFEGSELLCTWQKEGAFLECRLAPQSKDARIIKLNSDDPGLAMAERLLGLHKGFVQYPGSQYWWIVGIPYNF